MVWWESKYYSKRQSGLGFAKSKFINLDTIGKIHVYNKLNSGKSIILYNKYTDYSTPLNIQYSSNDEEDFKRELDELKSCMSKMAWWESKYLAKCCFKLDTIETNFINLDTISEISTNIKHNSFKTIVLMIMKTTSYEPLQINYNPNDEEEYQRELAELKSYMSKSGGQ